jgi:hypothetical protein
MSRSVCSKGDRRLPARALKELRVVAEQNGHVTGPETRRILPHVDLHLRHRQQEVQDLTDRPRAAGADVVHLSRLAFLEREKVGPNHVAHIREVSFGLEVAYVRDRRLALLLDVSDLLGEIGGHEHRTAPPSLVVEPTRAHAVDLPRHPILIAQHVLRDFAHRVWRKRVQGLVSLIGTSFGNTIPYSSLEQASWMRHSSPRRRTASKNVDLSQDVGRERLGGRAPGRRNERLSRKMENPLRPNRFERVASRRGVTKIAFHQGDATHEMLDVLRWAPPTLDAEDLAVATRQHVIHQMASRKAGHTGNENATHGFSGRTGAWLSKGAQT